MKPAELKQRLRDGKPVFGYMIWCMTGMRWKRVYAGCGLDFVVIDSEHGSRDRELIANTVEQFQSLDITAIVRTPSTDPIYVAMAMDAGADGVLVPYCEDIEEVKHCVGKLRTHPLKGEYYEKYVNSGEFPSDKTKEYFEKLHKDHIFIMGVESKPAADNIGNMIDAAKIDGVFIGPNDMTTSLGIPNQNDNPVYLDTLKHIIGEADKRGVPTMIHQQTIEASKVAIDLGARFILHSSDAGILLRGIQNEFAELKNIVNEKYGSDLSSSTSDESLGEV